MADIIGGIATSHTPTIGFAVDAKKQDDPVWKPIFEGYVPVQDWLEEKKPDVIFYIYNDHMTSFFADHYSHFALGVGDTFHPADEGGGPRDIAPIEGHPALAQHIAEAMVAQEFDLSYFQNKGLDHGAFSPMSLLVKLEEHDGWPMKLVPLQVGVLQPPTPTPLRCYKFGKALRRAIQSYPEDLKVVIAGTGGLSHQVHGERAGFNDPEWDAEFMDRLVNDPESLTEITIAEYARKGGWEGAEVVMWLLMRGAMAPKVKLLHQAYYLPSMCPIATMLMEDDVEDRPEAEIESLRRRKDEQLEGAEQLEGTYPFTIETAVRAFRLNNFLHELVKPEKRKIFVEDEERAFEEAGLTEEERVLVRNRDWQGLIHYGVIFFMLEKLGAVVDVPNPHIYAAMRGESIEDFQKTRNAAITYSVAGTDKQQA
ncbi:gallate dioxygenase [Parasphingopyxis marina]|uniref:Gallate dioxygenase n=1 Tax=Parasphingopyxis marina TaxID=2761622 RepID=A0A842I0R1_9SPHN|nr:gallate dioxygenase [Parasphingopyxis marina]MBC2778802.1 gallate dioxygenase [Parasphingopyxis marina]